MSIAFLHLLNRYLIFFFSRVKKEHLNYKKNIRNTDACQRSERPNLPEDLVLAASMMGIDLEIPGQVQEYGVPPASVVQSFSPGNMKE